MVVNLVRQKLSLIFFSEDHREMTRNGAID